jgi:hypothetical protein
MRVAERLSERRIDQRPRGLRLRRKVLGANRPIGLEGCAEGRRDTKVHRGEINTGPPEHFHDIGLQHDATAATIEVVRGTLVDVHLPTDSTQQIAGEQSTKRSANDDGAPRRREGISG